MDTPTIVHSPSIAAEARPALLTVVVPTFNERDNVTPLLNRLKAALSDIAWEVIFVDDDSPDGTAEVVRQIAMNDPQVRVVRRINRRGLSSACVEGILASSAPYVAIIDADMQHDEYVLPRMLKRLREESLDIVVGSRYTMGGSVAGWSRTRRRISRIAGSAARLLTKADLKDPMSGFFVMRRTAFDEAVHHLSQHGFKILLDLFASTPRPLRFAEEPYQFRLRQHGNSKLDGMAVWEYGMLLADKLAGSLMPPRFILFCIVGALGLLVHMSVLFASLSGGVTFLASQIFASVASIGSNYVFNNLLTYRDRRLSGWRFVLGAFLFYAICSIGAVANVGIAQSLYDFDSVWWFAGFAGALVGVVWNYAVSTFFVWHRA